MSDSEEDYMSDKLLQVGKEDVRPGLVFNKSTKRQYEFEKKRTEIAAKKPKNNKAREDELREKGLNTAISSDNKGFKLLEKMGFKQGQGLGKSKSGVTEPIKIEVKSGKLGIGVESHLKEKSRRKKEVKESTLENTLTAFQATIRIKQFHRYLQKDFVMAQKTCEDLDSRRHIFEPTEDFFWTKETIKKRKNIEEEDEEEFNEDFDSFCTEENLAIVINYLRTTHLYCMYCAFIAADHTDLRTSCPGPHRGDHDD